MRVLTYLPSRASTDDLHRALIDAGCEPVTVDDLDGLTDQMEPDEPALVVFDETVQDWLTFVTSLVQVRPSARPVLLAQIDTPDAFLCAVMAGVVGLVRLGSSKFVNMRPEQAFCVVRRSSPAARASKVFAIGSPALDGRLPVPTRPPSSGKQLRDRANWRKASTSI